MNKSNYTNSVFEQPWWLDIVAKNNWHEIVIMKNSKVMARMPYVLCHNKIYNPAFTQTLGIWFDETLLKEEKGNAHLYKQKEIIDEIIAKLPNVNNISIILDSNVKYVLPFRWFGFSIEPTFSYRIKNLKNIENIESIMTKKCVQRCNKASEKVRVIIDNSNIGINNLMYVINKTYERQNRNNPSDVKLVRQLVLTSINNNAGIIMLAIDDSNNIHSGAFFLYDEKTCYYLLGGQDSKYKSTGSQNLILKKGIEFASTVSNNFDFEGSMIEGIENFFRQFGGEIVTNYRIKKQNIIFDLIDLIKPRIKRIINYKN